MAIHKRIKEQDGRNRAKIKGQEIARLCKKGTRNRKSLRIEIVDINPIEGGLEAFVRAWKGRKQIGFGKDGSVDIERFRVFNPPILVDDPNGDIISEWVDEDTGEVKQRRLREDPEEALLQSLEHTILIMKNVHIGTRNIKKGKRGNTTSTFYPTAGANSPVDGWVRYTGSSSYSTTRDSATGTSVGVSDTVNAVFRHSFYGVNYEVWRTAFTFDTSSLTGEVVTSATFSLYGTGGTQNTNSDSLSLVGVTLATTDNVVVADYNKFGTTKFATDIAISSWNTTGYNNYTLNASGIANINTSVSQFGVRSANDISNSTPSGQNLCEAYYSDETGTSRDPKLVVEHETAPSASNVIQHHMQIAGGLM